MTDAEFCKLDTDYYGELVDNIKQIKLRTFDGEELKEYVEHCIKFNNVVLGSVSKSFYCETKRGCIDQCDDCSLTELAKDMAC